MREATRQKVRERANGYCEYCQIPQRFFIEPFHIEHVIAISHGGGDELDNLAQACGRCNLHKGRNLSGLDPNSSELTRLFHPRTDIWQEHFFVENGVVVGHTSIGRTTVQVLKMNHERWVEMRQIDEAMGS